MSTLNQDSSIESVKLKSRSNKIIAILATALALSFVGIGFLIVKSLEQNNSCENVNCSNVCCDQIKYNTITEESLDSMICNYRNEDWWKTSSLFGRDKSFSFDLWKQRMNTTPNSTMYDGNYDARYMDVSVTSLENYLCKLRVYGSEKAQYVRFYYIRYGNQSFKPVFANKHSLAMIPLDGKFNEMPNTGFLDPSLSATSLIFVSNIANHNELCPPEPPKGCSERLNRLDTTRATYN